MPCAIFDPRILKSRVAMISMIHHRKADILLLCHCAAQCGLIKLPASYHFVPFGRIIVFQALYCLPPGCCCFKSHLPLLLCHSSSDVFSSSPGSLSTIRFKVPFVLLVNSSQFNVTQLHERTVYFLSWSLIKMSAVIKKNTICDLI